MPTTRLVSLDVFRGITIAGMVLVNNPGTWEHIYWPLEHARWHGWTPTDLVFPFFVFIIGVAIPLVSGGRFAPGLALAWGLCWLGVARLTGDPESTQIAVGAFAVALLVLLVPLVMHLRRGGAPLRP